MKFLFFVGFNHEVLAQLLGWKSHNSQKTNQLPGSLRFLTKLRREIKNAIVRRSFHRKKQIMKRGYNFFSFCFAIAGTTSQPTQRQDWVICAPAA